MDACSDPALETVIFMSSSQVGKALDGAMSATVPAQPDDFFRARRAALGALASPSCTHVGA